MLALFIALISLATATGADARPPLAAYPIVQDDLVEQALLDQVAWDITKGLTTEVGQRMPGTEAEAKARAWALAKLAALGFANVREEGFTIPNVWIRGEEKIASWRSEGSGRRIAALGNSGSGYLTGLFRYYASLEELKQAPAEEVRDQIVFVDHAMRRTQDGSGYGAYGPVRWYGPNIAAEKGAAAFLMPSLGTGDDEHNLHTGNTTFAEGVTPIPAAAVSAYMAQQIRKGYGVRRRHGTVRSGGFLPELTLTPRFIGEQPSGNVIAELPGSDPSLPIILIACHLDSWDLSPGAFDNAAGCGIITAAAKQIMAQGQPLRTIRLLWAGAEEIGVFGGKAYAEKYADEAHALAMESDFGADRVWRVDLKLPEGSEELTERLHAALLPLGVIPGDEPAGGGADIRPIIAAQNLAVIDLQQDGTRYFDLHHSLNDTLDKVDPEQLRQNVAAWTAVLQIVANHPGPLRLPIQEK